MTKKIINIRVTYDDDTWAELRITDLEIMEQLKEPVRLLECARYVYDNLARVFGKLEP